MACPPGFESTLQQPGHAAPHGLGLALGTPDLAPPAASGKCGAGRPRKEPALRAGSAGAGQPVRVRCCIAGGGPAGMMLGLLLARAGIATLVLEKHRDFLRDFRGDTVHPSTLDVMGELGLLDSLLAIPHQELREIHGQVGDTEIELADFSHLPTRCRFLALMPQWDFLELLATQGRRYPSFGLRMQAEVKELVAKDGRVAGVEVASPQGDFQVAADLVIAADGRHSLVRARAGLPVLDLGAPIDVLWMRLSKLPHDPPQSLGRVNFGRLLVMIDRGDYWQCGYVIRKGHGDEIKARGIEAFHGEVAKVAPYLRDRLPELRSWDDVKLLSVRVDRLKRWWKPGLLCIGDAAHAMSPIGGVGINLAIQDAVAAANILAQPLLDGRLAGRHLQAVQRRRTFPTRVTQAIQVIVQTRVLDRVLGDDQPITAPWPLRLFNRWPWLRRIPPRVIGVGVRPEHVRSPDAGAGPSRAAP
ncbi:MAG: FAD-dependent oxidoreductase [Acidobacteria bacterium]|nr:FAD-dependent oxidoreductase [Acidobacteriota bacterium]